MTGISISFKSATKKTNIRHNNRTLTEEEFKEPEHNHIIRKLSDNNIYVRQTPINDVYEREFGQALIDYNAKQKRSDRQIKNYRTHVRKSNTLDEQREFVIALGDKDDWDNLGQEEKEQAGQKLAEYLEDFEVRHPQLKVYNAVVHLDETGAPHAHLNIVPVAEGYKNGLQRQPSFSKALYQEGNKERGRGQFRAFRDEELKILEKKLNELGHERKLVGTNSIKDMREYKEKIGEINELVAEKHNEVLQLESLIDDISPLKEDIEELKQEKYLLEKDNNTLRNELTSLEEKIDVSKDFAEDLSAEVLQKTKDLSESEKKIEEIKKQNQDIKDWSVAYELDELPTEAEIDEIIETMQDYKKIPMTDVVKYSFSNLEKVAQFVYPITEKVKSLVGKIEKLISENKILKNNISKLQSEISNLKSDGYVKENEFNNKIKFANDRIANLKDKNKNLELDSKMLKSIVDVLDDDERDMISDRIKESGRKQTRSRGRSR
ncbi:MAG: plasmid recombination protein [Caldibacillus thermoamylovorans]